MSCVKSPRFPILLACGALALAACGATSTSADGQGGADTETGEPFEEAPVPTIGLGSDLGAISGSADLRAIDTGEVDSIQMIGDSITVGSTPYLQERFDFLGFETVGINAQNSKRIGLSFGDNPSGADIATFVSNGLDGDPEHTLWVVALGTNDIGQYDGPEPIGEVVDAVLDAIPDESPVIWIDSYHGERLDQTAELNAVIEERLRARGNATIGRWSALAPADGVLRSDLIHPSDDGAVVFADLVVATVADFLQ